jgi:MoaA/NifB/PqqE/SkfB family radical SAM enzyme
MVYDMNGTTSERLNEDRGCRFRRIKSAGFRLAVEVTRRCNLSCNHCFVRPDQNQPSLNEITEVIQQAGKLNCQKLIITGGEPLLRQDIDQIIAAATSQGILVDLNSNFYNLTGARIKTLKAAGLQEASVSLYGGRCIHDGLTGRKGAFDQVLRGIVCALDAGIAVDVHGAIWNDMLPYVGDLIDTVQKIGVSSITFFSVLPKETKANQDKYSLFLALALKTIEEARVASSIPVRTVGLCRLAPGECAMGNGIYGLAADLQISPCLLSRRKNKRNGVDLHTQSLVSAMALLDVQIKHDEWCNACQRHAERILDA